MNKFRRQKPSTESVDDLAPQVAGDDALNGPGQVSKREFVKTLLISGVSLVSVAGIAGAAGAVAVAPRTAEATSDFTTGESNNVFLLPGTGYKVGIGITSPGRFVEIKAPSAHTYLRLNTDSSSYASVVMFSHNSTDDATIEVDPSTSDLTFWRSVSSSWSESLRLKNSNGNLGIGTASPQAKLEVSSSSSEDGIRVKAATYPEILLVEGSTVRGVFAVAGSAGGFLTGSLAHSTVLYGTDALHLGSNGALRLTIDTAGKVGLGTTAPVVGLDMRGTIVSDNGLRILIGATDLTTAGAGVGGGLSFGGQYSGASTANFGGIDAVKETGSTSDLAGSLRLFSRPTGAPGTSNITERVRAGPY